MAITLDKEMEYKLERMKKSFTIEGKLEYLREALKKHEWLADWHEYQAQKHRETANYIKAMIRLLELKQRRPTKNASGVQA